MHIGVPRLPSRRLPRGFPPFRRVQPRSELATSSWKAQCRLVLAVHEENGSRVTGCGHTWCLGRWETTPLLSGVQVSCLRQPTSDPACRLFPSSVQVLPIVVPPSSAMLVVGRWSHRPTVEHLRPFPAPADTAQGRGKERQMCLWSPQASASSLAARTSSCLSRRISTCTVTLLSVHPASGYEA